MKKSVRVVQEVDQEEESSSVEEEGDKYEEEEEEDDEDDEDDEEEDDSGESEESSSENSSSDSDASVLDCKVVMLKSKEVHAFSTSTTKIFEKISKRMKKEYGTLPRLTYVDKEGDHVLVKAQRDFKYIIRDYRSSVANSESKPVLRLQADLVDERSSATTTENRGGKLVGISTSSLLSTELSEADIRKSVGLAGGQMKEMIWQKGELIGSGSFGSVYRGIDSSSGEIIAVKEVRLRKGKRYKQQALALQQELRVLSALDHPNIIRYLGAEYAHTTLRIFLELATEGSVKDAINEFGALSEPVIRRYTADIVAGLHFLHSHRYVHRDIKPTNLLIHKNVVKLADFGCAISSLADELGNSAGVEGAVGTTIYMSPEVMGGGGTEDDRGDADNDLFADDPFAPSHGRKADIWSLGVSIVEMARGEAPYRSAAAAIYHVCVAHDYPSLPPTMSVEAAAFVARCLVEDPNSRADCLELISLPFCSQPLDSRVQLTLTRSARQTSSMLTYYPLDGSQDIGRLLAAAGDSSKDLDSPSISSAGIVSTDYNDDFHETGGDLSVTGDNNLFLNNSALLNMPQSLSLRSTNTGVVRNVKSAPGRSRLK